MKQPLTIAPEIFYDNFCEYSRLLPTVEVIRDDSLTGSKTKADFPWLNFLWGAPPTAENLARAQELMENRSFCWIVRPGESIPEGSALHTIAHFPVMGRMLDDYEGILVDEKVFIRATAADEDLAIPMAIAAAGFGYPQAAIETMPPQPTPGKLDLLIASYEGTPAAICITCLQAETLGLYYMATLPDFRRKGLCRALIDHAFKVGRAHGATQAVLIASPEGALAYSTMGFEVLENPIGAIWNSE